MSYILEALQKSDRERKSGDVPDLSAQHAVFFDEKEPLLLWPWALAGSILLSTAVLAFVFWPEKDVQKVQRPYIESPEVREGPTLVAAQSSGSQTKVNSFNREQLALNSEAPAKTYRLSQPVPVKPQARITKPTPVPVEPSEKLAKVETANSSSRAPSKTTPTPAENNVADPSALIASLPALSDLDASIRDALPALDFSSHIYSTDPQKSFVMVNGLILVENERVVDNLKIARILPKHVVLQYDDTLFYMDSLKSYRP